MKWLFFLGIGALIIVLAAAKLHHSGLVFARSGTISLNEVRDSVEKKQALVLDARTAAVFRAGHIPGAVNLPYARFSVFYPKLRDQLVSAREIIVYCNGPGCGAAEEVRDFLVARGFVNAREFSDGWAAWTLAGLPVEKVETPVPEPVVP